MQVERVVSYADKLKGHMRVQWTSRREFLTRLSTAAIAVNASSKWLWALGPGQSDSIAIPGEDGMIVRSARFFDLETPVELLNTWITPIPHFFVRNHMHEPSELSAESWRLTRLGRHVGSAWK